MGSSSFFSRGSAHSFTRTEAAKTVASWQGTDHQTVLLQWEHEKNREQIGELIKYLKSQEPEKVREYDLITEQEKWENGAYERNRILVEIDVSIKEIFNGINRKVDYIVTTPYFKEKIPQNNVLVVLPPFFKNGQAFAISGHGIYSDLYTRNLIMNVKHDFYEVVGNNLYATVNLPKETLRNGGTINIVDALNNPKKISFPEASEGKVIRIKNQGVPNGPNMRGDIFIRLERKKIFGIF